MTARPRDGTAAGRLAAAVFAVAPPATLLGANAAVPAVMILAAIGLVRHGRPRVAPVWRPALGALAAFFAWGVLSALWSPAPTSSLAAGANGLAMIAFAAAATTAVRGLGPADARRAGNALILGLGVAAGLALVEAGTGQAIGRLLAASRGLPYFDERAPNRGLTDLALLAAPAAVLLVRREAPFTAALLMAALGTALASLPSLAAGVALLAAAALLPAVPFLSRVVPALALAFAVLAAATPWLARHAAPPDGPTALIRAVPRSAQQRLIIWHAAADQIDRRPWRGAGLRANRHLPRAWGGAARARGPGFLRDLAVANHPHNLIVQGWVELGGVGVVLLTLAAGAVLRAAAATEGGVSGVVAYLVVGLTSYDLASTQWLASAGLLAAATALAAPPRAGRVPRDALPSPSA